MPGPRGVKRSASKTSASAPPKIKKKPVQLEVPTLNAVKCRMLTCGQGDVGQLGLGEDVMEATRFKFVSALGDKIVDACAGGMHTVALDSDGKVWTFGCNDEGALGRSNSGDGEEFNCGTVDLPGKAVQITAGDSHSAALLHDGQVYVWGSFRDSHGSMGLVCEGREGKACREPVRLPLNESTAQIASGDNHFVALTTSGAVYTLGCAEQGQLGRVSQRSSSRHARQGLSALLSPTAITLRGVVKNIWAGSHATLTLIAAATRDKVLVCGLNNYAQLGVSGEKNKGALYAPVESDAFAAINGDWIQVACGQHHSLALQNGQCYALGRCDYGRLGLGKDSGDAEQLKTIPKLENKTCISIAATTSSSFAVTDTGELYAWGMGSVGQLGTGNEDDQWEPTLVTGMALQGKKAIKVCAGGQHTVVLVTGVEDATDKDTIMASTSETREVKKTEDKKEEKKEDKKEDKKKKKEVAATPEPMEVETEPVKKVNGDETDSKTPMEIDADDISKDEKPVLNGNSTNENEDAEIAEDISEKTEEISEKPEKVSDKPDVILEKSDIFSVKSEKVSAIPEKVSDISEKVSAIPDKVSDISEKVSAITEKVAGLSEKVSAIPEKVSDISEKVLDNIEKVTESSEKVSENSEKVSEVKTLTVSNESATEVTR